MNIDQIEKQIENQERFNNYQGEDRVIKVQEVYEEEKKNQKPVFFKTGINSLDCLIGGFKKGQLIVITGMPKRGKTTLAKTNRKSREI
jgi:replicative DNA helicase